MAHPTPTATTTTTTMTPVISTSNLPISLTLSTSYDPSQSSLSSASGGHDKSTMEVFFANSGMIEGDEFDSTAFRAVYSMFLSPEQKRTYLAALEVAEKDTGKKVSHKLVVGADDFDDEEQRILKDAADTMMSNKSNDVPEEIRGEGSSAKSSRKANLSKWKKKLKQDE
jgi:hypothetical protein